MDTYETIMTRRSVRKFTSGEVGDDLVEKLLRAAMQAPSANNGQPWHFIVIRDRAILDEIPTFHPFAQMVKQAPLAILVCADTRDARSPDYWVLDCSAATENLLLAAHALDLGAVWLGIHPRQERMEKIIPLVKLPEGVKPLGAGRDRCSRRTPPLCGSFQTGAHPPRYLVEPSVPLCNGIRYFEAYPAGVAYPPVMLLHGAGASHLAWPGSLRRLDGLRVISPDLPGHGDSHAKACASIRAYAERLLEFVDHLGVFHIGLAGHSMGALIALEMTRLAADQVTCLALLSVGINPPSVPAHLPVDRSAGRTRDGPPGFA